MRHAPIATFINMATVTVGGLLGLWLNNVFPPEIETIIFQAIGLCTLVMGVMMCLKMRDGYMLIFIFSMLIGGIIGQVLEIDKGLLQLGETLKTSLSIGDARFTEGLVTAFLLFCVGSMTILGAIEEGLTGKRELLLIKATLDGITSVAFAATYGVGVLFVIFPMLLLQGGITLAAGSLEKFFTESILAQISAVGGALILAIGIRMLRLGDINIENLLPALLVTVLLTRLYDNFPKTSPPPELSAPKND